MWMYWGSVMHMHIQACTTSKSGFSFWIKVEILLLLRVSFPSFQYQTILNIQRTKCGRAEIENTCALYACGSHLIMCYCLHTSVQAQECVCMMYVCMYVCMYADVYMQSVWAITLTCLPDCVCICGAHMCNSSYVINCGYLTCLLIDAQPSTCPCI